MPLNTTTAILKLSKVDDKVTQIELVTTNTKFILTEIPDEITKYMNEIIRLAEETCR